MRHLWLALALGGCGYAPCGTVEYWSAAVDDRFDKDGDQYLDLEEACGADYGSFGAYFPDVGWAQLLFDSSQWDLGDASDLNYDYLPITELVFKTDHLAIGEVMTNDHIGGYGFHKPAGSFDSPTTSWPLTSARIEVLAGPRETDFGGESWRLDWEIVIGTPDAQAPRGYQILRGKDWVPFEDALWTWDAPGHAGIFPPDAAN
jgi:hypothetical protein